MLTNYHTLGYVAAEFHAALRGKRIASVFTQVADELVMLFEDDGPPLLFSCEATLNTAYFHPRFARARNNSTDLLRDAHGAAIVSVTLHPSDRVITLLLGNGNRLFLQFFGPRANALLCTGAGVTIDAFRNGRAIIGTVVAERSGDLVYDLERLAPGLAGSSDENIARTLRSLFPSLGGTLTAEVLFRAKVPSGSSPGQLEGDAVARLRSSLEEILVSLSAPAPRVYLDRRGLPKLFSIIPLAHCGELEERLFPTFSAALHYFVSRTRSGADFEQRLSELRLPLRNQHQKILRTLAAMEKDLEEADRAASYERFGQRIMAALPSLAKGEKALVVAGETIPLDPARTPVQNAQRYFNRAKKARTAAEEQKQRIALAQKRAKSAAGLLEALDAVTDRDALDAIALTHAETLEEFGLTPRARERAQLPFRIFMVDGGFEVWAGKSSANNDLLTLRHAKPDDLWFHARGSSGSHVVLKIATGKGEPGRGAKEQAAAIAAYYSKSSGSSLVPVAMTERRYVRKPKGAPPGTVVIEREKVLFVRPQLPNPVSH